MTTDFSSVIRYGLPGWTFVMVLALPHLLSLSFKAPVSTSLLTLGSAGQNSSITALAGLVVVVAIPIGFIIYQFYFANDWILARLEDWSGWSLIPIETARGTRVERDVLNEPDTHKAWFIVEQYWYAMLAAKGKDAIAILSGRASRLFDLYHALGAIQMAIVLALMVHVFNPSQWQLVLQKQVAFPSLFVTACLSWAIYKNRQYTRRNLIQFQNAALKYLEGKGGIFGN